MLHLQKHLLSLLRAASPLPTSSLSTLQRLLSPTTNTTSSSSTPSTNHFSVQDYLITSCHLSPAQSLKASKHLSHLKSPSKPDAVLAFLADLGLSTADIATAVAADPLLLCANVDKTLNPRAAELHDLGLSSTQIARLIPHACTSFRSRSLGRNLRFWLPFFGSFDKFIQALRANSGLLGSDLEKVIEPNIALLKHCGLGVCDIAKIFVNASRVLTKNYKLVLDTVERVNELGVSRNSQMFGYALATVASLSREKVDMKMGILKTLGWSQADVTMLVSKSPKILAFSEEKLRRGMEFLKGEVGLEIEYIARRPALLMYSLERRLAPRHYVLKVLKAKGLPDTDWDFYRAASLAEKKFLCKLVRPYKESVPGLADAYASACAGNVTIGVAL